MSASPPPPPPDSLDFRNRAESIDAMEILDELMTSFDADDHHHDHDHHHDTLGASPTRHYHNNASNEYDDLSWRLTNPVHMELQENARLPSFVVNVDRTGSSNVSARSSKRHQPPFYFTDNNNALDQQHDIMQNNDGNHAGQPNQPPQSRRTNTLGEAFLGGQRHASHAHVGALQRYSTTTNYNYHQEPPSALNPSSGGLAPPLLHLLQTPPLPPREAARGRGDSMEQLFDYQMMDSMTDDNNGNDKINNNNKQQQQQQQQQQHPYAFKDDDENEEKKDSAGNYEQQHPALQLVDPTPLEEIRKRQQSSSSSAQRHLGQRMQDLLPIPVHEHDPAAASQAAVENTHRDTVPHADLQHEDTPKQPSALASTSTPSKSSFTNNSTSILPTAMERASQQKSQYGFGRKHKVPSIPEPHSHKKLKTTAAAATASAAMHDDGDDSESNANGNQNSGDAYERKKHRAKVARVKLNESIEQLSIAIHVAGTQSKERASQWQGVVQPTTSLAFSGSVPTCLSEASVAAEKAKKWDRPSFVGSAAKMVEYLNSQCDILMRELVATKNELRNVEHNNKRNADENGGMNTDEALESKRCRADESLPEQIGEAEMQPAVDITIENGMVMLLASPRINSCIASFVDPVSLVRCTQVSKPFKRHLSQSSAWDDMAIQRFGFFNVRQWREKLEDADEGISCLPIHLYKSMDTENVMPHFNHDGMFLLGEARLQGVISAWTFLVERSNGETLRSCKRSDGQNAFTSLPVVELRTVVQNTGKHADMILLREQLQSVDASTRRRGVEMKEIAWDDRFQKRVLNLDGSIRPSVEVSGLEASKVLCQLALFESAVIQTFVHAQGCSTQSKFVQRSNFTKVLVQIRDGTTVPLVIPFPRDHSYNLEH